MTNPVPRTIQDNVNNSGLGNVPALTYPSDMNNSTDFMQIIFYSYQRNNPIQPNSAHKLTSITLPLPMAGLEDRYNIQYNKINGGVLGSLVDRGWNNFTGADNFDVTKTLLGAGGILVGKAISTTVLETLKLLPGTTDGVSVSDAQGLAEQVIGKTINPNPSLAFNGMALKTYTFSWKFVPRTPAESTTVQQIIYYLKNAGLPSRVSQGGNFLLAYPQIVQLTFHGPSTPLIEMSNQGMVIENIVVNYENDGHPHFYKDSGQPVSTYLTVAFQDRSIMTSDQLVPPAPASPPG